MWINHSNKASDHAFIKLTKCFQTRMSFNLACLAQTFKFLVASIGAILFEIKPEEDLSLERIVKTIEHTKLLLNRQIKITLRFILSKMSVK